MAFLPFSDDSTTTFHIPVVQGGREIKRTLPLLFRSDATVLRCRCTLVWVLLAVELDKDGTVCGTTDVGGVMNCFLADTHCIVCIPPVGGNLLLLSDC